MQCTYPSSSSSSSASAAAAAASASSLQSFNLFCAHIRHHPQPHHHRHPHHHPHHHHHHHFNPIGPQLIGSRRGGRGSATSALGLRHGAHGGADEGGQARPSTLLCNISLSSSWATRPGQAFQKVEDLFQDGQDPDFWPESMSPFYTLPTGARSCYNHVVMAGLQVFGSQLTFLLMFTFCKYQLHWINAECDVQAFVEADGEADLDVYRAVIR